MDFVLCTQKVFSVQAIALSKAYSWEPRFLEPNQLKTAVKLPSLPSSAFVLGEITLEAIAERVLKHVAPLWYTATHIL